MGFDSTRLQVTDEPVKVTHPDKDLQPGYNAVCRCDQGDVMVGGDDLTVDNGYLVSAGVEFSFDSKDGVPSVIAAVGAGPLDLFVLWGGV